MNYKVIHFDSIDSTNLYVKNNYLSLPSFTFVDADYQTNGKGRNTRVWESNNKENLLFSLLIKDRKIMDDFSFISLGTAYVIARYLESIGVNDVSVKWPNDVYVNDKKICGVLLEGSIPKYLVIGVGLNVNQIEFPDGLRTPATSIYEELNKKMDIEVVKNDIFNALYGFIASLKENKEECEQFIASHNYLLSKRVKINELEGTVVGLTPDFALLLEVNGQIHTISSGEIDFIFTK